VVLHTLRLTLRPFRGDDLEPIESFAHEPAYLRFLDDHPDPAQFVANNLDVDGAWIIERDGRVIGSIFLRDELACLVDPAFHGQGVAIEAATAVLDDAFDRRGYDVIVARAHPDNIASVRALLRLGFTPGETGSYSLRASGWSGELS
jgi:RimJ/RimL family protein N-acetyltransferase